MPSINPNVTAAAIPFLQTTINLLTTIRDDLLESTTHSMPSASSEVSDAETTGIKAARPAHYYDLRSFDFRRFDPRWKGKVRLSETGIKAICFAIMSGMEFAKIAALFEINLSIVYDYDKRLKGQAPWGFAKIPNWL